MMMIVTFFKWEPVVPSTVLDVSDEAEGQQHGPQMEAQTLGWKNQWGQENSTASRESKLASLPLPFWNLDLFFYFNTDFSENETLILT